MSADDVHYKGYRISSYISPNLQFRWIYREDEWIDEEVEFNLKEKMVTIEDCKKIIDGWVDSMEPEEQVEQMTLF